MKDALELADSGPFLPWSSAVPADNQAVLIAQTQEAQTRARTYAGSRGELALGRVWFGSNCETILFCEYMRIPSKGAGLGIYRLSLMVGWWLWWLTLSSGTVKEITYLTLVCLFYFVF